MDWKIVRAIGVKLKKYWGSKVCDIPSFSLKTYLYITLGIILLTLGLYCNSLNTQVEKLKIDNSNLTLVYNQKVDALKTCSDSVTTFKNRESELSKNMAEALDKAKKEAVVDYKAANEYLFKKPKVPHVTPENSHEYGGKDKEAQLKDYLSTQQLFNDLVDRRTTK